MSCTRLDITYVVSKLSWYTSIPRAIHLIAIMRALRYLRYTQNYGLCYTRYPTVLEGYCNANWISDMKDFKSTSGYIFTLRVLLCLENHRNKHVLLGLQWNQSSQL